MFQINFKIPKVVETGKIQATDYFQQIFKFNIIIFIFE